MLKQNISRTRVGKGLTVLSEQMPGVCSISLGFWIKKGSRDENRRTMGLSHLYEHMIFKGTEKRTPKEIACVLEKSGGSLNAFTSKEQVCIHARFVDNDLAKACELIQDIFLNSTFSEEELKKEKNVILEEISASEDNPEEFAHDELMENLWPGHSLGFPIAGRKENILGFTKSNLLSFNRIMSESELVISAAGNVKHKELCGYFENFRKAPGRIECVRRKSHNTLGKKSVYNKDIQQANVAIGFKVCPFVSEEKYPLFVFNALLGDGMSSRLFQRIREELGLVYSIYSFHEAYEDTGVLGVFFGTEPANLQKALKQVMAEIRNLANGEITNTELDFAKSYIKGNVLLGMENTGNRMGQLARSEIYLGKTESLDKTIEKINKVKIEDIQRVGTKYFTDRNLAVASVVPSSKALKTSVESIKVSL